MHDLGWPACAATTITIITMVIAIMVIRGIIGIIVTVINNTVSLIARRDTAGVRPGPRDRGRGTSAQKAVPSAGKGWRSGMGVRGFGFWPRAQGPGWPSLHCSWVASRGCIGIRLGVRRMKSPK